MKPSPPAGHRRAADPPATATELAWLDTLPESPQLTVLRKELAEPTRARRCAPAAAMDATAEAVRGVTE